MKDSKAGKIAVINEREKQTGRPLHGVWKACEEASGRYSPWWKADQE